MSASQTQSSEYAQRAAANMDSEVRRIERAGMRSITTATIKLRAGVIRAWVRGGDLYAPIDEFQSELHDSLLASMTTAYLQGVVRSKAIAERYSRKRGLSLAKSLRRQLDELTNLSRFGKTDLQVLADKLSKQATTRVVDAGSVVRSKVADAVSEAIKKGESVRTAATRITRAMDASGVTAQNPYLSETLYRTSLQESYAAARWQTNQQPEIDDILWGYEYSATLDDRTTDLCSDLDGTRRAKGDAFWSRYMPPNHYNCRSIAVEIFKDETDLAAATPVPKVPLPPEGFQTNVGTEFV